MFEELISRASKFFGNEQNCTLGGKCTKIIDMQSSFITIMQRLNDNCIQEKYCPILWQVVQTAVKPG